MPDQKYIFKNYHKWIFKKRLPEKARHLSKGSSFFIKSLDTSDIREARRRRNALLMWLDQEIEKTIGEDERSKYRKWLIEVTRLQDDEQENLENIDLELLQKEHGTAAVKAVNTVVREIEYKEFGYSLKDALLDYKAYKEQFIKNKKDIDRAVLAVDSFLAYLKVNDIPLAEIKRKHVMNWLAQLDKSGHTKKGYLSKIKGVWKRAYDLGEIEGENPFMDHEIPTNTQQSYQLFADSELESVFALVRKETNMARRLVPLIGLTTGCRIEEICALRTGDVIMEGGHFFLNITDGKTAAARRVVPVHSILTKMLKKWLKEREGEEWMFDLNAVADKRSHALSKWFGYIKKKVVGSDRTKSFHSLRVHMATALERAKVPESTATWILGHERKVSMSYGLYSKGMELSQLREAVESIRLPVWLTE